MQPSNPPSSGPKRFHAQKQPHDGQQKPSLARASFYREKKLFRFEMCYERQPRRTASTE
jgi:hypothetical protein